MTMTITVPTSDQLGARFEGFARATAAVVVAVYVAGAWTRDTLQGFASWTRKLTSAPLQTLIDLVPTVDPEPELMFTTRDLLRVLEAQVLEPAELELEIREFEAQTKPLARRKPAKARKATAAA